MLEPQLLHRLRDAPQAVFAAYDLSEEERDILSSPDERMLALLGRVHRAAGAAPGAPEAGARGGAEIAAQVRSLAESRLVLRLVPYLQRPPQPAGEGEPPIVVSYLGHLDPLPAGASVDELPPVPRPAVPGQALPPLTLIVAVTPQVAGAGGDSLEVAFSMRTELSARTPRPDDNRSAGGAADLGPWRHDTGSAAVRAAARRVRSAGPGDRYQRLLELIEVMVRPAPAESA